MGRWWPIAVVPIFEGALVVRKEVIREILSRATGLFISGVGLVRLRHPLQLMKLCCLRGASARRAAVWAPVTPVTAQVERQAARNAWRQTAARPPCETTLSTKAPGSIRARSGSISPPFGWEGHAPSPLVTVFGYGFC